jgi:hypothetical protein
MSRCAAKANTVTAMNRAITTITTIFTILQTDAPCGSHCRSLVLSRELGN